MFEIQKLEGLAYKAYEDNDIIDSDLETPEDREAI